MSGDEEVHPGTRAFWMAQSPETRKAMDDLYGITTWMSDEYMRRQAECTVRLKDEGHGDRLEADIKLVCEAALYDAMQTFRDTGSGRDQLDAIFRLCTELWDTLTAHEKTYFDD